MEHVTGAEFDIAIIGGGAAGLATAIFAARTGAARRIIVLDGAKKLGAKILVAGGGRCNVTNVRVMPQDFCGGSRNTIRRVLAAFPVDQTVAFFREIGVPLHEEKWGKLFPDSNDGRTVLAALLNEAQRRGVAVQGGRRVAMVVPPSGADDFAIHLTAGGVLRAARVVLATGGLALPKSGSDGGGYAIAAALGHSIVPTTPALAPLLLDGAAHAGLSGVAHEAEIVVSLQGAKPVRIRGPLLWTHFGVSGPVVLDASRHWLRARLESRAAAVSVGFLPGGSREATESQLMAVSAAHPRMMLGGALAQLVPARLGEALLAGLGVSERLQLSQLPRETRHRVVQALFDWPLAVRDSRGYTFAEATAGGVPLDEIDPATMASRRCPGLFLAGEILDVDGRIGGFNFQWAWSSGFVAGKAAAADQNPPREAIG